jgi:hypothetical protein
MSFYAPTQVLKPSVDGSHFKHPTTDSPAAINRFGRQKLTRDA